MDVAKNFCSYKCTFPNVKNLPQKVFVKSCYDIIRMFGKMFDLSKHMR